MTLQASGFSRAELRELADQAQAEAASGVVSANEPYSLGWLDGVEEALRWVTGDGASTELRRLIERFEEVRGQA